MNGPFDPKRASSGVARAEPSERRIPVAPRSPTSVSRPEEDDARASSKYRAALEALFTKTAEKPAAVAEPEAARPAKIVSVPTRDDPRREERDKRLAKLMAAEGRLAVTKACEAYLNAKLELPVTQEVMLTLLDHDRDDRVGFAIASLSTLLDEEAPQRRAVLEARLRRLEADAENADIRAAAEALRKKLARGGR
jgi:hypothetical protein